MNISVCRLPAALLLCALAGAANAGTTSGTVGVQVDLTRACKINGSVGNSNFGSLSFGTHTTLFDNATAEVGNGASAGISIQCSPGADAVLSFNSGQYDGAVAGGNRALYCSASHQYLPYDIYSDSSYTTLLSSGQSVNVTADGLEKTVRIYGRAKGVTGLYAGSYTDTISVQLDF